MEELFATRAADLTTTKKFLLHLATKLWNRAKARLPLPQMMEDDEGLLDALRALQLPAEDDVAACTAELEDSLAAETLYTCADGQLVLIGLPRWAQCGFPEIQLAETYAAALLATVVTEDVLGLVRAPFPVFLLEVPNGLLSLDTDNGPSPLRWILVLRGPEGTDKWAYVAWSTSPACLWRFGVKTAQLLPPKLPGADLTEVSLFPLTVTERDERVASLIGRLIVNTCLAMSDPERVRAPAPKQSRRSKAGKKRDSAEPRTNVFKVGQPIEHDFRPAVRDYLAGKRHELGVLQTLVAGHWKRQPHGPGFSLRRLIYVMPYWRGEAGAPILVRPIRLK